MASQKAGLVLTDDVQRLAAYPLYRHGPHFRRKITRTFDSKVGAADKSEYDRDSRYWLGMAPQCRIAEIAAQLREIS